MFSHIKEEREAFLKEKQTSLSVIKNMYKRIFSDGVYSSVAEESIKHFRNSLIENGEASIFNLTLRGESTVRALAIKVNSYIETYGEKGEKEVEEYKVELSGSKQRLGYELSFNSPARFKEDLIEEILDQSSDLYAGDVAGIICVA